MREYFMLLIGVSLFSGMIHMLAPEGNLKRYLRLLCSLILLCVLIRPVLSLLRSDSLGWLSGGEYDKESDRLYYEEIYHQNLMKADAEEIGKNLKYRISEEFSLDENSISVSVIVTTENDKNAVKCVNIIFHKEAISVNPRPIIEYVENLLSCQCVILYD